MSATRPPAASGDEVACGKPDPAVYLLAAARIGIDPAHCLAFEDCENGTLAALASGAQVVVVPDLKHPAPAASGMPAWTRTTCRKATPAR